MRIWIDADGCPVVQKTIEVAKNVTVPVTLVKNHAIELHSDYATVITVDVSQDAADFYIVSHMAASDLVVTQDIGLAALVLARGGYCINPIGRMIDANNIDILLSSRHLNRVMRTQNHKGPKFKKRTPSDDVAYEAGLRAFLSR